MTSMRTLTTEHALADEGVTSIPRLGCGASRAALVKPEVAAAAKISVSPQQRLLILDTWRRSGLPAADFAALVNVSKHTLLCVEERFEEQGPAGLMDQPRGREGRQPVAGVDQAHDLDAQGVESRLGLRADQRHAVAWTGVAGQRVGRGPGAA